MWEINDRLWELVLNILVFTGTVSILVVGLMVIATLAFGAYMWCEWQVKTALNNRISRYLFNMKNKD